MSPAKKEKYKNPFPTVDVIVQVTRPDGRRGIVLVRRGNPPPGWALPGGFVDYGETLEHAAVREAKEETDLDIRLVAQFHAYSRPDRDPRFHTITTVFIAEAEGEPRGGDDAAEARVFTAEELPETMAFDHAEIVADYLDGKYPF